MSKNCQNCGSICTDDEMFCHQCGAKFAAPGEVPPAYAQGPWPGMKWFKFIIYIQLFASAAISALSGVAYIAGLVYGEETEKIYSLAPVLKAVDAAMGVYMLCFAAFAILTRMWLAKYRKMGVTAYLSLLAADIAAPIIYAVAASVVLGTPSVFSSIFSSIIPSAVMLVINAVYFGKRKDIFVK